MRGFIKNLIIFLTPIALATLGIEMSLRKIPSEYKKKYDYLKCDSLSETLILGSSHTLCGINPDHLGKPSYNASLVSQTLDIDKVILQNAIEINPKLKTVILRWSYQTLYEVLEDTKESWRLKNYYMYFGDWFEDKRSFKNAELLKVSFRKNIHRLCEYYLFNRKMEFSNSSGWGNTFQDRGPFSIKVSCENTIKRQCIYDTSRVKECINQLEQIILLCVDHDIDLFIVTTPISKCLYAGIDKAKWLRSMRVVESFASQNKRVNYMNFINDRRFSNSDFYDSDHLNSKGAIKLTRILNLLLLEK